MGKSGYKTPPSVQTATEAAQSRVQNDMQYPLSQAQLYQNQLRIQRQFANSAPTWLEPANPQYDAHIVAYRSRPKWGRRQERAATIVAFAALLPPILAVPIINRQTRSITP